MTSNFINAPRLGRLIKVPVRTFYSDAILFSVIKVWRRRVALSNGFAMIYVRHSPSASPASRAPLSSSGVLQCPALPGLPTCRSQGSPRLLINNESQSYHSTNRKSNLVNLVAGETFKRGCVGMRVCVGDNVPFYWKLLCGWFIRSRGGGGWRTPTLSTLICGDFIIYIYIFKNKSLFVCCKSYYELEWNPCFQIPYRRV